MKILNFIKEINIAHKNLLLGVTALTFLLFLSLNFNPQIFQGLAGEYFWPLYKGLIPFTATLLLLLVCKKHFKIWLATIASWYVPLAVLFIANTEVYGDMYSYGRSATALALMSGLFIITLIFVVVVKLRERKRKRLGQ